MSKENNKKGFFKSFIPLSVEGNKIKIFEKEVGGKSVKFLRGIATNTLVDKEDERMSKNFVSKIKQSAMGLNVFSEHDHSIDKTVGFVDEVSGDDNNVVLDVALEDEEDNSIVKSVLKKINHGTKIGYSIGGRILKAKRVFDDVLQKYINEIEDGEIYEVSLTAMPAGEGTWVEPIQKSLNEFVKENNAEPEAAEENIDGIKKHLKKALDEMMQENKIKEEMWDLFYAFKQSMYQIVESNELTPEQKKEKIINISEEFGMKIEEFSSKIVELSTIIEEQFGIKEE
jgi:phage head maturation protease